MSREPWHWSESWIVGMAVGYILSGVVLFILDRWL